MIGCFPQGPCLDGPLRQFMISWVAHLLQGEPGCWHHCDRGVADSSLSDFGQPFMITLTGGDRDQRSDERSDHRVAKGIGAYGALDDTGHRTGWYALTSQREQGTDRATPLAPPTESTEIPQTKEGRSFGIQLGKIDFGAHQGNLISVQRIR